MGAGLKKEPICRDIDAAASQTMLLPRIKICCIRSEAEAALAIRAGAAALGLVSQMPSGPGVISEQRIARIAATIPPGVTPVLLTSRITLAEIMAQQWHCGVHTLQLCDRVEMKVYSALRRALPGVKLIQVIHVVGEAAIAQARRIAALVDALLLDSGNPDLKVKELGGTGRQHDWNLSRRICAEVARPVFLAGGLTPANVAEAVRIVRPFGLDVCTGVRTAGALDERKLRAFFEAAQAAAASPAA